MSGRWDLGDELSGDSGPDLTMPNTATSGERAPAGVPATPEPLLTAVLVALETLLLLTLIALRRGRNST